MFCWILCMESVSCCILNTNRPKMNFKYFQKNKNTISRKKKKVYKKIKLHWKNTAKLYTTWFYQNSMICLMIKLICMSNRIIGHRDFH